MKLLIIVSVSLIFAVKCDGTENCDKLGILLYEDMACKPTYDKNNSCPVKFDCLGLMKSNNNCYFKGRTYRIDEQIDSKLTASSCNLGCFCEKEDDTTGYNTYIVCVKPTSASYEKGQTEWRLVIKGTGARAQP
ncbi:hypothetical protein NQ318_020645 [Aromia moschata]|uniref:Secreted protein n=1 Tax=Aromia moschata TaxID=1265417 RepID=A0AAV8XF59_9CUCU|nr:hypothetical protein NQ318_020645 [Aromia moschata]